MPKLKGNPLFGVSLSTLLSGEGKVKYKTGESLRKALRLPNDARLALIGTVSDDTIEKFWTKSDDTAAWDRIAGLGFEFSTALTYSVWDEHPRFDQITNQKKNLLTHDCLLASGVISVPFLFFYDDLDYKEAVAWMTKRKDIRRVAILAQFKRREIDFDQLLKEMHRLEGDLSRSLQFLVIGPSTAGRIKRLFDEFSAVSIVTSEPVFKALWNHRTLSDLSHVPADERIPKSILAASNIEMYRRFCSRYRRAKRVREPSTRQLAPLLSQISV